MFNIFLQSFTDLVHKPLIVDLTVEEGQRLKVLYGSRHGFHGIDVDEMLAYDLYIPTHVSTKGHYFDKWVIVQKGFLFVSSKY